MKCQEPTSTVVSFTTLTVFEHSCRSALYLSLSSIGGWRPVPYPPFGAHCAVLDKALEASTASNSFVLSFFTAHDPLLQSEQKGTCEVLGTPDPAKECSTKTNTPFAVWPKKASQSIVIRRTYNT